MRGPVYSGVAWASIRSAEAVAIPAPRSRDTIKNTDEEPDGSDALGKMRKLREVKMSPYTAAAAKSLQSCLTLWDPIDGSPPGSPIPGILQARTLDWITIYYYNELMDTGNDHQQLLLLLLPLLLLLLSRFSRVRLCDPIDGSPSGSSIPGIFQARVLEWVAISFSNA
ncbi:hypothetical protein MG293_000298 [Ovis ammon polii]|uniref:Uncharacterized protein n=1 Tax=Ovis ammon polii TaxID=230172 RepID=A0AAD4UIR3_OVIAM|nr:hypothetical protein MG293_000298 [Ovis ammon polii]